jgi:hypothetical protein
VFSTKAKHFIQRLSLLGCIQFDCFDSQGIGLIERMTKEPTRETAPAISRLGQHHSNPGQLLSVTHHSCGCGHLTIHLHGEAASGSKLASPLGFGSTWTWQTFRKRPQYHRHSAIANVLLKLWASVLPKPLHEVWKSNPRLWYPRMPFFLPSKGEEAIVLECLQC